MVETEKLDRKQKNWPFEVALKLFNFYLQRMGNYGKGKKKRGCVTGSEVFFFLVTVVTSDSKAYGERGERERGQSCRQIDYALVVGLSLYFLFSPDQDTVRANDK